MPDTCANPLYLQWIQEWWDTANSVNAKDRLTFKRAWESMKACPLELNHPSEAIKLAGIGPKLVEKLTERLESYCRAEGLPMPVKPWKKRRQTDGAIDDDNTGTAAPKRARKAGKSYVPKFRSGAYALLLTLADLPEGQTVGLTKEELKHQAQPLADASFTVAPDPSKFHTAWNSMGQLESKHLVYTFGRPTKRYALTEEGWLLAKSMKETNASEHARENTDVASIDVSTSRPLLSVSRTPHITILDDEDDDSTQGKNRDTADFETRIRQKFGSRDEFMTTMARHLVGMHSTLDQEALDLINEFARRGTGVQSTGQNSTVSAQSRKDLGLQGSKIRTEPSGAAEQRGMNSRISSPASFPAMVNKRSRITPDSMRNVSSNEPMYNPIIAPPGSFTVELILDSREVRSKTDRNYLQDQFNQIGLRCEQRALQVGDMIWTARIHDQTVINRLDADDRKTPEVVLDYVVERKRLDDLDTSIKDGRFLEQKFRLKRSGIKNAIYIIEDYGSLQAMEDKQHTRLTTAMAATQIIDGIFVKRTRKLDDTIAYLASITRMLKTKYESKALHIIPTSVLSPQNHFILRSPRTQADEPRYITYEAQASLTSKSATLTLRDVFLKMLMCTRGITGDKAIELQKHWSTPRAFREALAALAGQNEKGDLVWKVAGNLPGKRKIGKAASQTLAEIWGISPQ